MKTSINENNVLTYYIIYFFINSLTTISKNIYVYSSNAVTNLVVGDQFLGLHSFKEAPLEEDWQTRKFQNKVLKPTTTATLLPEETPY